MGRTKAEDLAAKSAMKPGSVSRGIDWGADEDGGAFQVVGRKKNNPRPAPKPVATEAPKREYVQKFVPAGYVPGAEPVNQQPKKKPAPKQQKQAPKPAPKQQAEDEWSTVKKKKPQQGSQSSPGLADWQKSDKQLKAEEQRARQAAVKEQNSAVVGAAPAGLTPAEKKQQEREAKKRLKEMEKQRLAQQQKQQQQHQHQDPQGGFAKVVKGAKTAKPPPKMTELGSQTTFSKLRKQQQHMKVPKQQKSRAIEGISQEEIQARMKKHHEELTKRPEDSVVDFKVCIQDKWYSVKSLMEVEGFKHAPKMVQAAANQQKVIGGFFIASEGKYWASERTVDDWWMATTYLTGMTKLLSTLEDQSITPYWASEKEGADSATAVLKLHRHTLQPDCYPTVSLVHAQKHGTQLQEVQCSIHQFTTELLEESRRLSEFLDKINEAVAELAQSKKFSSKPKQDQLKEFQSKLPSKLDTLITNLQYAFEEFNEKHPLPQEKKEVTEEEEEEGDDRKEEAEPEAEE